MSGAVEGVALLPCPFCGGDGAIESQPSYSQAANTHERHRGWCDECGYGLEWHSYEADAIDAWNTRTTPPARSYADEDVALEAAISAMGWTDKRMVEDARKIAAGFWFETYGFGGDCCLTGSQTTSFRSCLDGARAAIRLLSQGGKA